MGLLLCSTAYDALASSTPSEPTHPAPPSINRIRELAELTVLEVEATDVVDSHVRGRTGGTRVIVLVHGTITLSVDLDKARYLQVDQEHRVLVLGLPKPTVRRAGIDPSMCRVLSCERTGLWQMAVGSAREGEAIASAMAAGHDRLIHAASEDGLVSRARQHAEAVLCRFVNELGWTLEVRWDG